MGQEKSKEYQRNADSATRIARFHALVKEFETEGGFSKKQAVYLINLLEEFIPLI